MIGTGTRYTLTREGGRISITVEGCPNPMPPLSPIGAAAFLIAAQVGLAAAEHVMPVDGADYAEELAALPPAYVITGSQIRAFVVGRVILRLALNALEEEARGDPALALTLASMRSSER